MKKNEINATIKVVRDFFDSSETFHSITMSGLYTLEFNVFINAFRHYLKTGENVLDQYSDIHYLYWDTKKSKEKYSNEIVYTNEQIEYYEQLINNKLFWDIDSIYDNPNDFVEVNTFLQERKEINSKMKGVKK